MSLSLVRRKCVPKGVGDVLLLVRGDAVEERKGERAEGYGFGEWEVDGGAGMGLPGGLLVDGGK